MIKSAQRALELLEYFGEHRRAATVMDIARCYGYPQSSASEMLRCLSALGYLTYDRYTRTFAPTVRVAMIGAWVMPDLFRQGKLLAAVDRVASETDCPVMVATALNYVVHHVHHAGWGEERPETDSLLHSPQGRVALAAYPERISLGAIHRLNAAESDSARRVRPAEFMDHLRLITARGWDAGEDGAGLRVIAVPVPFARSERLVLAVASEAAPQEMHARLAAILDGSARPRAHRQEEHAGRPVAATAAGLGYSAA